MRPGFLALAAIALPLLTGCGSDGLSRTFGLQRDAPDEFRVTTRAPLSMPPDLTLRPPSPGAGRPQELSAAGAGESVLVPQASLAAGAGAVSPGASALLQAAGGPAPDDIRARVNREAAVDQLPRPLVDRLMFWRKPDQDGLIVEPRIEAQRLRENAALGKGALEGETTIIRERRPGLLDRLF